MDSTVDLHKIERCDPSLLLLKFPRTALKSPVVLQASSQGRQSICPEKTAILERKQQAVMSRVQPRVQCPALLCRLKHNGAESRDNVNVNIILNATSSCEREQARHTRLVRPAGISHKQLCVNTNILYRYHKSRSLVCQS